LAENAAEFFSPGDEADMNKTFSDPKHLRDKQYRAPDNLMSRVALYDRFLQGPSLQDLRLDAAKIDPNESVIDFGCGNALIWSRALDRRALPDDLTLVDLSAGMLAAASAALSEAAPVLIEHDLSLPLELDRQFDVACAFHMLYHLQEPLEAMDEILRHIKPGGRGIIHLNAPGHLAVLRRLVIDFEGDAVASDAFIQGEPSAEAAMDHWQSRFAQCESADAIQDLHVTESEPLLDYILSIEALHGNRYGDAERRQAFAEFLELKVEEAKGVAGHLLIQTHTVLLKFENKL
jgi:SAM-dependent methyltransferase